jgi:GxxExxY protein
MNTDDGKLLEADKTREIIGAAMEVHNTLRHGLNEKPCENALVVEFQRRGIPFEQQRRFEVDYKGCTVAEFVPDLVVYGTIIVDAKAIDRITDHERGQRLNYLRITGLRVGLIINFSHARLEWERLVL